MSLQASTKNTTATLIPRRDRNRIVEIGWLCILINERDYRNLPDERTAGLSGVENSQRSHFHPAI